MWQKRIEETLNPKLESCSIWIFFSRHGTVPGHGTSRDLSRKRRTVQKTRPHPRADFLDRTFLSVHLLSLGLCPLGRYGDVMECFLTLVQWNIYGPLGPAHSNTVLLLLQSATL